MWDSFGPRRERLREKLQHVAALASATGDHRQHPLHEAAAPLAIRAKTRLPPADGMTHRPLGRVVRRLHAGLRRKRPQARLDRQDFPADARRHRTACRGREAFALPRAAKSRASGRTSGGCACRPGPSASARRGRRRAAAECCGALRNRERAAARDREYLAPPTPRGRAPAAPSAARPGARSVRPRRARGRAGSAFPSGSGCRPSGSGTASPPPPSSR